MNVWTVNDPAEMRRLFHLGVDGIFTDDPAPGPANFGGQMIPSEWLDQANQRLKGKVNVTPLLGDAQAGWFIKWENQQETGSFKLRGALNKVMTLLPEEQAAGLVCASAGNHGQGVAVAGRQVGAHVIVFASEHAVPTKLAAMQQLGAEVRLVAGGYAEAEAAGKAYSSEDRHDLDFTL